jgi:hypothetical protein
MIISSTKNNKQIRTPRDSASDGIIFKANCQLPSTTWRFTKSHCSFANFRHSNGVHNTNSFPLIKECILCCIEAWRIVVGDITFYTGVHRGIFVTTIPASCKVQLSICSSQSTMELVDMRRSRRNIIRTSFAWLLFSCFLLVSISL